MSKTVTKESLLEVLPDVLKNDPYMQELAETTAEALTSFWSNIRVPNIYARIMELPEEMLDILAKDFKVDWYDQSYDLETKRKIIHDSWYVHKRLGTVGALKKALSDIFPDSDIEEWFDFSGDPGTFRVMIRDESTSYDLVQKTIRTYKRASAHVDSVNYVADSETEPLRFSTAVSGIEVNDYATTGYAMIISQIEDLYISDIENMNVSEISALEGETEA